MDRFEFNVQFRIDRHAPAEHNNKKVGPHECLGRRCFPGAPRHFAGSRLFDAAPRGRYATDASIYQVTPVGVAIPRHQQDLRMARALG